ncbi:MAG TPA: hypothetical protein VH089_19640 [Streptosporangiaceae bacterium]|nr:hypothetical protein [Streptosporangiaceae bacterium]
MAVGTLPFGRSGRAAVAITGLAAFSNGFEFVVTRLIRPDTPGWDEEPFAAHGEFEVSLRLSDGRVVHGGGPGWDTEPTEPFLRPTGGGATSHYSQRRWWAWPLPPGGPLEFSCRWPAMGISEARVSIDADLILAAADRVIQVWPESPA